MTSGVTAAAVVVVPFLLSQSADAFADLSLQGVLHSAEAFADLSLSVHAVLQSADAELVFAVLSQHALFASAVFAASFLATVFGGS